LVAASLTAVSNLAYAFESTFRGFVEGGNKTTIEAIEGTETLDYDYAKYYLRYRRLVGKPLTLTFVYSSNLKKFEDREELDNNTVSVKSYWDYSLFLKKESTLKFDFDLGWREKRYRDKDLYTNSQWISKLKSTYEVENLWSVSGELGYKDYDYFLTRGKDRIEFSERVEGKRYFYGKRLHLRALLNLRQTDFDSRPDTNQFIYRLGFKARPESSFLSEMEGRLEEGRKYTDEDIEEESEERVEEEQEGDYYFRYRKWWLRTKHPLFKRMYTVAKYTNYNKDYASVDYDFSWYEIETRWRYLLLENFFRRFAFVFVYLYRETGYSEMETSSYDKDLMEMVADYYCKNNWRALIKLDLGIEDYNIGREKDKKTYTLGLQFEKEMIPDRIALAAEYKYKLNDYEISQDKVQKRGRISIDYKF